MSANDLSRLEVEALTRAIMERGFDVDRLAEAARITPDFMRMILFGEIKPSVHVRRALAEALGIDPGSIQ